jgi:surface protein
MRPEALLLLVLAVSGARRSSAAAFADRTALKLAVDNCLAKVPSGFECCSRASDPADCGVAGTTDMPDWDVSNIITFEDLFQNGGEGFHASFNQDIGNWDVSAVTNMRRMLYGAKAFNQNIGSWDVSGVTNMLGMLADCEVFNQDIRGWDVSGVFDMSFLFMNCDAFNQDITGWTTTALTDSLDMFISATAFLAAHTNCGTGSSASGFPPCVVDSVASKTPNDVVSNTVSSGADNDGPPSAWQSVTKFQSKAALATAINNCLGGFGTGYECCSTGGANCGVAGTVDMRGWDVSGVTDMELLFLNYPAFNEPINNWDVAQVTTMEGMFSDGDFNQDIASWNTRRVTTMKDMFVNTGFFDQNIGSWNTGAVIDMSGMFKDTGTFNGDISAWDVSKVQDMESMFQDATSFNQDITSWSHDPSGPYYNNMFKDATAFLTAFTNCGYYAFNGQPIPVLCEVANGGRLGTYEGATNEIDGPPDAWQINPVVLATPTTTPTLAPAAPVRDGYNAPATCSQTCKECNKFRWYIKTVPKSTPTSATRNLRRSACQRCRDCRRT